MTATLATITPSNRQLYAFTTGAVTALGIDNRGEYTLRVSLGGVLFDKIPAGTSRTYPLANATNYGGWVLLVPVRDSASISEPYRLGTPIILTTYGGADVIPYGSATQPGEMAATDDLYAVDPYLTALRRRRFATRQFGCVGDGVTDDGPAFRALLAACQVMGGGQVWLEVGLYYCTVGTNAENSSYQACGFVPGNTEVCGDGTTVTTIKLQDTAPDDAKVLMNWHIQSGGDENITLRDLTLDGNAQHQAMTAGHAGKGWYSLRMRGLRAQNVRFKDVYGTANSGGAEGFDCTFDLGTDAAFVNCEALATTANTATGFSANQSSNISYVSCIGRGHGFGHGFTHNTCVGVLHVNCFAYQNGTHGFNTEASSDVRYVACRGGGAAVNAASYPYTPAQSLGNTSNGFTINGTVSVTLQSCQGSKNGGSGLQILNVSSGTGVVQVQGGEYSGNSAYGISAGFADVIKVTGAVILTGNTTAQMRSASIDHVTTGSMTAASIPASTTALVNPYAIPCAVTVTGGTVTAIAINGVTVAGVAGTYYLQPGNTITLTYSVAPTWTWVGML